MMAVDLHSPELLLPSNLLYDAEATVAEKNLNLKECSTYYQSWEALPGTESVFSSPVESELGSAEAGTDMDDDYIAELARQMAHSMLDDDGENSLPCSEKSGKTWGSADSPQSTLWSPLGSNLGSPDGPSQEPSPPPTPLIFGGDRPFSDGTYDVGRLEKMDLNDYEMPKYLDEGLRSMPFKPNVGLNSNEALTDDQLRAIQFSRPKQRVPTQQGSPNWGGQAKISQQPERRQQPQQFQKKGGSVDGGRATRTNPWIQTQQQVKCHQQNGSGMKIFFLGSDSGSTESSCGTGVFLPRGIWYSSESRKKPGCSPVFIPARVVQALQHHFDQMSVRSQSNAGGSSLQHDASMMGRRNILNSKQKRHSRTVPVTSHHDMGLPQEWTY
ncbi:hypothetical protein I3843_13G073100 [Carya illinoinensis]|uniref:Uncharacterized protein n=1 Tax=Carya illinoinensis TaxID=32201 RepID=A0A922AMW9_CARIL|nr:hypothetical protein I3760_13G085600 [Carya illinoinensis]KAG6681285.1 hypothetical protein I3842_13G085700 [Carya illinoinensis]KAG7949640.1 hypothetical protein I3843_13G073100 [Carya illinoinensis]